MTQDGAGSEAERAADLLTLRLNRSIEHHIEALWPKNALDTFLNTVQAQGPDKVSALRIWYDMASTASPNEAISFLMHQASMSAQAALYFPHSSAQADITLGLLTPAPTFIRTA